MRVIYIDAFFVVNFLMDMVVLLITAGVARLSASIGRIMAGAVFGAVWAVLVVVLGAGGRHMLLSGLLTYTLAAFGMIRLAFGRQTRKRMFRIYFILMAVICCMSGVIQLIGFNTMLGYCIITGILHNEVLYCAVAVILALSVYYIRLGRIRFVYGNGVCRVEIRLEGKTYQLDGYLDTGNTLKDPIFGNPVHVMNLGVLGGVYPEKKHYIPYHSIGSTNGILPVVWAEEMTVHYAGEKKSYIKPEIALYEGSISTDREYDILLNSEIIK